METITRILFSKNKKNESCRKWCTSRNTSKKEATFVSLLSIGKKELKILLTYLRLEISSDLVHMKEGSSQKVLRLFCLVFLPSRGSYRRQRAFWF